MGVTAAAGSATSVHVMWNQVSGGMEVSGYEVYHGTTRVKRVPGDEHMVDVTRLTPSTTYVFTVRALNTDGNSGPPSEPVRATTPVAVAADRTPPTRPERPHGTAVGSRAAQLEWSPSADARGVASYDIYQGASKIHSVGGGQTATVVTGLRPGTAYTFTVRARDAADNLSPRAPPSGSPPRRARTTAGAPLRPSSARPPTARTARTTSTCPGFRRARTG